MLLQNTLDLSTFEIVRFRIWNQTSQPSDRGFGSKYFNTNSGHEAYCREEIFTPIGWRTAAYMDDIDKINEKLDLIFGDELDTDTIIDSWKEVQDFLAGIEDTKTLMTMLDGKLDKTGGTISGTDYRPLAVNSSYVANNVGTVRVELRHNNRIKGHFGWDSNFGLHFYNNKSGAYLGIADSDGTPFYASFGKINTLIHEGNIGDYALKIDGSNTMTGNLKMTEGKAILWGSANLLQYTTSKFIIGRSASIDERPTEIHGYPIIFRYGNDEGTAMTITEEGNVNVGGDTVLAKIVSFTTGETYYNRAGANYLWAPKEGGHFVIGVGANAGDAYASLSIYDYAVRPGRRDNAVSLGTSSYRWSDVYSVLGDFSGLATFNGGALIPTGQTLTIGSVTFRETAAGEVEVDGNLHATGTLASGGKGEAGENTTGNAMVYQYDLASGESVYTVDNVKGSTNVIVQIFEWNSNTSSWDMILTDVSVKADAITVTFGRTTTVNHMVTVC